MDQRITDQLDKVLAMADSCHDGEAAAAVRKARQLLSRDGLSFSDLARAASSTRPRLNLPFTLFSGQQAQMETQLVLLRQKVSDMTAEVAAQAAQLDYWRRRAGELEQNFNQSSSEAQRWRQLARETVEKLWDIGKTIRMDEFTSDQPAPEAPPAKTADKI